MSIELKIKSKHLGQEAKIIRFEERKLAAAAKSQRLHQYHEGARVTSMARENLYLHRINDVRNENRATFLARAYLEGKPYSFVEQKREERKEWIFQTKVLPRVLTMVNKYGSKDKQTTKEALIAWSKI